LVVHIPYQVNTMALFENLNNCYVDAAMLGCPSE